VLNCVRRALLPFLAMLAGCGEEAAPPPARIGKPEANMVSSAPRVSDETLDDGRLSGGKASEAGDAQQAATVLETYYALIEAGKYREAWKLRWSKAADKPDAFAESFGKYASYHATVGAPSQPQEAAGSLYVEVPVQIYGQLKGGKPFGSAGSVTLRRKNGSGATPQERKWRIYS